MRATALVLVLAAGSLTATCSLFVPDDRELAPPEVTPRASESPLQPPQVIADGQPGLSGVAVDAQNVYFTAELEGAVRSIPKTGDGPVAAVSISEEERPTEIVSDGVRVYWTVGSKLMRAEPRGQNKLVVFDNQANSWAPLKRVWLGPASFALTSANGAVWQKLRSGAPTVSLGPRNARTAVDGGASFYWITATSLVRFMMPSGPEVELARDEASPQDLAIDEANLYWITSGGEVKKIPRESALGDATTLASGQASPVRMALDATHVYFTNAGDGTVRRVPKEGGPVEDIATGQGEPFAITVDADGVYWTNRSGAVMVARR